MIASITLWADRRSLSTVGKLWPARMRSMSRDTLRLPNVASKYWATFKACEALSSRR